MPNCIGAERVRLRLSQTDLGDKLGVSRSIIVRIERDPKSATLRSTRENVAVVRVLHPVPAR